MRPIEVVPEPSDLAEVYLWVYLLDDSSQVLDRVDFRLCNHTGISREHLTLHSMVHPHLAFKARKQSEERISVCGARRFAKMSCGSIESSAYAEYCARRPYSQLANERRDLRAGQGEDDFHRHNGEHAVDSRIRVGHRAGNA